MVSRICVNKMIKSKLLIFAIFCLALYSSAIFVSSVGGGSLYSSDNPLQMNYGETKKIDILLTNKDADNLDRTFEIQIKEGSEIASLEKTTYIVKGGSEMNIPLTISISKDYNKQVQKIELSYKIVTSNQGGMVSLGIGGTIASFNVILSEKEVSKSTLSTIIIILIVAIIVLALIIYMLLLRKRK